MAVIFPDRNLSLGPARAASTGDAPCVQTVDSTTGVSVSYTGGKCVIQFTSTSTAINWTSPTGITAIDVLVVGGGGGGGSRGAGGGGAGGYIEATNYAVTAGNSYSVVVGEGGSGGTASTATRGSTGGASSFHLGGVGLTANGGGGGRVHGDGAFGGNSGSGSGTGGTAYQYDGARGTESNGCGFNDWCGGGGGGAGSAGTAAGGLTSGTGGAGGSGRSSSISGTAVTYAGGGGGGGGSSGGSSGSPSSTHTAGGMGGSGGGGAGGTAVGSGSCTPTDGTAGTNGLGGGGGGSGYCDWGTAAQGAGGAGGSGIVIVSYTPVTTPGTPTSLTVTPSATSGQVSVSWTAPASNGGSAITDYSVQWSTNNSTWTTDSDTSTGTTATVSGLAACTPYYFRVAASNAIGTGSYTSAVQSMAFSDSFSATYASADFRTGGNTTTSGSGPSTVVQLTAATGNQKGSVWANSRISLASSFCVSGEVYLGNADAGADGMAF
ncbi:MAG: glycine-rich domain-containing protein, partial [Ilumatobacteraceae bacterium]